VLKSLKLNGRRRAFYSLRRTFETVATVADQVAVDGIMGHSAPSMGRSIASGFPMPDCELLQTTFGPGCSRQRLRQQYQQQTADDSGPPMVPGVLVRSAVERERGLRELRAGTWCAVCGKRIQNRLACPGHTFEAVKLVLVNR